MPWFAVMTKPGRAQWDLACVSLRDAGIEVYAPLCCEAPGARRAKPSKVSVMFPWYLLVKQPDVGANWLAVDRAWGVDGVLRPSWRDRPSPLRDGVVDALRALENVSGLIELVPRFNPGQGLRITRGIFTGREGIVSQKASKRVGCLKALVGPWEVELDEGDVEPIAAVA